MAPGMRVKKKRSGLEAHRRAPSRAPTHSTEAGHARRDRARSRDRDDEDHDDQLISPRPKRVRGLLSHETIYADVDTAKRAFDEERHQAIMNRAPTPFHTAHGDESDETIQIERIDSRPSLRSRVSFESTRSRRTIQELADASIMSTAGDSQATTLGAWEPTFGGRHGIGAAGESYEVMGLGRKSPRHRKFPAHKLKSAMRPASRMPSRNDLRGDHHPYDDHPPGAGQSMRARRDKPLPTRPLSYVAPAMNTLFSSTANLSRQFLPMMTTPTPMPMPMPNPHHSRSMSMSASPNPAPANTNTPAALRSLFSSLTLDPSASRQRLAPHVHGHGTRGQRDLLLPAEDLFAYLHSATVPSWRDWPPSGPPSRHGTIFSATRSKGFESMGWEWRRRLQLAEANRHSRGIRNWEGANKHWERKIMDWIEDNVPSQPVDPANRWGNQIFALPANGFDTLEFFDEQQQSADDHGLLSWVTGALLQTITSTLHMLRYSSSNFQFHVIAGPRPPLPTPLLDDEKPNETYAGPLCLWEGFGTMVLVNKEDQVDRAMIIEIRPPDVVDDRVLKEFSRRSRHEGWWHLPGETCIGDAGQANLLQAQVYDDCVQNNVYYFVVTNLKQWVFGSFNSSFSACTTSSVIDRKQREPSLVQCLATWAIRSVDERPRRAERPRNPLPHNAGHSHASQPNPSDLRNRRSAAPTPSPQMPMSGGFDFTPDPSTFTASSTTSLSSYPHTPHTAYGPGPPGYFDMSMGGGAYPQPGYPGLAGGGGYPSWNASQRAFSPLPVPSYGANTGSWYTGGFGWPMR